MNSYVSEEDATSIYVFFTTEDTLAKINQPAENSVPEQQYLKKIKLVCAESETEAKTTLNRDGDHKYNIIDVNLTPGRDKCYTYLGYQVQETEDKAATDIRMGLKVSESTEAMLYGSGSYANCGSNHRGDSMFCTSFTQMGEAITTDFQIVNDPSEAKEGYEPITSFGGLPYNFNQPQDFAITGSSKWFRGYGLFSKEKTLDDIKEYVGKPVYVYFRPAKTYTKAELEKDGGTAQEYISGMEIYECVPYITSMSKADQSSTWDYESYMEYVSYYAKFVGAETRILYLLEGVVYERDYNDILNGRGSLGEPTTLMLFTKTYNPKRALYDIRSCTSTPDSSGLPACIGSVNNGAYAAAGFAFGAIDVSAAEVTEETAAVVVRDGVSTPYMADKMSEACKDALNAGKGAVLKLMNDWRPGKVNKIDVTLKMSGEKLSVTFSDILLAGLKVNRKTDYVSSMIASSKAEIECSVPDSLLDLSNLSEERLKEVLDGIYASDGSAEARNGDQEMFRTERLLEALNKTPEAPAKELLENVRREVDAFVGDAPQFDDLTMLGIKLLP